MKLIVKKGLDIPLMAAPKKWLPSLKKPSFIALNFDEFENARITPLVDVGTVVKIGTPLAENKKIAGQYFVSPAAGIICDIRRGEKRVLTNIVIEVSENETYEEYGGCSVTAPQEEIFSFLLRTGIFAHIRKRPFNFLADPKKPPRNIFVTALETLPFVPSSEMQIEGEEGAFQYGLLALQKLTSGSVLLVARPDSPLMKFDQGIQTYSVTGPHPAGNPSVHIHHLAPIKNVEDVVWTLTALDVVVLGSMMKTGRYFTKRVLGIGGDAIPEEKRGFINARMGFPIHELLGNENDSVRLISGSPLTGHAVKPTDFLKFSDTCACAFPENDFREPLHFLKLGLNKYSMHKAYATAHIKPKEEGFAFTTNQHGEERPFIDGSVYDQVMPMQIPTMPLVRAVLAEDFELAEQLGLLEIVPEDFALSAFICPSKIDMVDMVRKGINIFSKDLED